MSNEQKLREALQLCRAALDKPSLADTLRKYAMRAADEALATTEPEPTGMPEVKPWDHPEPQTMRWSDLEIRWIHSYGEQCWKAGYKHGAWADKPAVNQQLTTEPFDEREAFEQVIADAAGDGAIRRWPNDKGESYENARVQDYRQGWVWCLDWQARAAMAQGVK